jgi:phosphatidate cytidylyltransferase
MAAPAEPALPWSRKPLTLRLISAAVLIPIVVAAVYAGHPAWDLLVVLFGTVMAWEWSRIATRSRPAVSPQARWSASIVSPLLVGILLLAYAFRDTLPPLLEPLSRPGFTLAVIAVATAYALPHYRLASIWFGLGVTYVAIPCIAIIALRAGPDLGLQQILWIVALVIAADTGAYIAGRSIGGPKLAPRVSPNKTWAGLFGAVVSAAIVGAITAFVLDRPSVWALTVLSGGLAIVEQAGDLAESAFKRHFGVKDASNIIPGHGGALDRVDGLIAVAATVAGINYEIGSSVLRWL